MTVQRIVILIVLVGAGYFAYTKFGGQEKVKEATTVDHYTMGETEFTGGRFEQVIEHYTKALKEKPDDPRATIAEYRIARAHDQLKHDSEALKLYEAFLAKHPDHADKQLIRKRIETYKLQGIK